MSFAKLRVMTTPRLLAAGLLCTLFGTSSASSAAKSINDNLRQSVIKGSLGVLGKHARSVSVLNGSRMGVVVRENPAYGKIVITPKGNVKFLANRHTVASKLTLAHLRGMGLNRASLMRAIQETHLILKQKGAVPTTPSELVISPIFDTYAHFGAIPGPPPKHE
jgi:hypothetical protein